MHHIIKIISVYVLCMQCLFSAESPDNPNLVRIDGNTGFISFDDILHQESVIMPIHSQKSADVEQGGKPQTPSSPKTKTTELNRATSLVEVSLDTPRGSPAPDDGKTLPTAKRIDHHPRRLVVASHMTPRIYTRYLPECIQPFSTPDKNKFFLWAVTLGALGTGTAGFFGYGLNESWCHHGCSDYIAAGVGLAFMTACMCCFCVCGCVTGDIDD